MTGLPIDIQHLDRDIYCLLVFLSASKQLTAFEENDSDAIYMLRTQFEASEAAKQLISVAVCLRNSIDSGRKVFADDTALQKPVGKIYVTGRIQNLGFRDACHKIIHATDLEFKERKSNGRACISPSVILWGIHKNVEWEARINVIEFARVAYRLNS